MLIALGDTESKLEQERQALANMPDFTIRSLSCYLSNSEGRALQPTHDCVTSEDIIAFLRHYNVYIAHDDDEIRETVEIFMNIHGHFNDSSLDFQLNYKELSNIFLAKTYLQMIPDRG